MAREVITLRDIQSLNSPDHVSKLPAGSTYQAGKDGYVDRLFKYIPAEMVAAYIFTEGVLAKLSSVKELQFFHWSLFIVFCILTPLYLWRLQNVLKLQQHIISLLSFVVWVFALGGPFELYSWYNPVYGELLLPVFTLIVAIWEAEKPAT